MRINTMKQTPTRIGIIAEFRRLTLHIRRHERHDRFSGLLRGRLDEMVVGRRGAAFADEEVREESFLYTDDSPEPAEYIRNGEAGGSRRHK